MHKICFSPLLQETFRCDFWCVCRLEIACRLLLLLFFSVFVSRWRDISVCAWADVSRDACQVYVAVHSLSLAIQVWCTKWMYYNAAWH